MSRVREARLAKGMTLMQLAVKANLSITSVVSIEADRVSPMIETAQALAGALDTTLDWLWPMIDQAQTERV